MDFISPFISLLWPILAVLGAIAAAWGYGKSKERKGRAEGRAQEQERSEKVVRKVDAEMKAEIDKPRTSTKTKDRLGKGTF